MSLCMRVLFRSRQSTKSQLCLLTSLSMRVFLRTSQAIWVLLLTLTKRPLRTLLRSPRPMLMLRSLKERPTTWTTRRKVKTEIKIRRPRVLRDNRITKRENQEDRESKENQKNRRSLESLENQERRKKTKSQERVVKEINQRLLLRPNNNKKLLTIYFLILQEVINSWVLWLYLIYMKEISHQAVILCLNINLRFLNTVWSVRVHRSQLYIIVYYWVS